MKTLRRKLVTPFIVLVLISSIIAIILGNVFYIKITQMHIELELLKTAKHVSTQINKQIENNEGKEYNAVLENVIFNLRQEVRDTTDNINIEIFVFNEAKEKIYPTIYNYNFVNKKLENDIVGHLDKINAENIFREKISGVRYFATGVNVTLMPDNRKLYFIFTSAVDTSKLTITIINFSVIPLLVIVFCIAIWSVLKISKKIEEPIQELYEATKSIADMNEYRILTQSDIYEIDRLAKGLERMSRKILVHDRLQKMFIQNASHEIKNPLMSIQGYAEGIKNGIFEDTKEAGEIIANESQRLNKIITELLTLYKIENQNYITENEEEDLNKIMREYVRILRGVAVKNKKEIKLEECKEKLVVKYNEELLYQTVINIANNAIRYAKNKVTIRLEKQEQFAVIEIIDDGEGIQEDENEKIFDRFYKGKGGQFGLGLTIARKAAKEMGGEISARNMSYGTSFRVILPLVEIDENLNNQ